MSGYIKREDATSKPFRYLLPNGKMSLPVVFVKDIENLPAADVVERPRWIPVEERLPEMYQPVLTFDGEFHAVEMRVPYILGDDGEQIESDWWVDADNDINTEYYRGLRDGAATHWMPLPEPPKGVCNAD